MAISQLLMAAQRPPGRKPLFTTFPIEDPYRDVIYHGGGLDLPFLAIWHGLAARRARSRPAAPHATRRPPSR